MGRRRRKRRKRRTCELTPQPKLSPRSKPDPAKAAPTHDLVESLVADLRADGDPAGAGEFTLDRSVALEKLRRYQLAEPRGYVMELVQTASLKGATWIDFDMDTDDLWMRFDGRPYTAQGLQEVYAAVFRTDTDDEIRAQQQLALGLNAALALRPRWIRVTSIGKEDRVELDIGSDRHEVTQGIPEPLTSAKRRRDTHAVTTIHVKARLQWSLLRRFVKTLRRALPEEQILHRRALYSTLEIRVNGRNVSQGLTPPDAVHEVRYEEEGITVVCALVPGFEPPQVHWVSNGALITTTELRGSGAEGFEAVVDASALRKNVSRTDVVHDHLYDRALKLVDRGRNKLKMSSRGQKQQADERYKAVTGELDLIYNNAAARYERLHALGDLSLKLGFAMVPVTILTLALLAAYAEAHWPWIFVPLSLLVGSFSAPAACGRSARALLRRARRRFAERFPRGNPERRLALRSLRKRQDRQNGTLAEDLQRRR